MGPEKENGSGFGYYLVMESEEANVVVMEKLDNGESRWEENPPSLEDRNSLARVIRSVECRIPRTRATFQDVKNFQAKEGASIVDRRMYAQRAFIQAVGGVTQ